MIGKNLRNFNDFLKAVDTIDEKMLIRLENENDEEEEEEEENRLKEEEKEMIAEKLHKLCEITGGGFLSTEPTQEDTIADLYNFAHSSKKTKKEKKIPAQKQTIKQMWKEKTKANFR